MAITQRTKWTSSMKDKERKRGDKAQDNFQGFTERCLWWIKRRMSVEDKMGDVCSSICALLWLVDFGELTSKDELNSGTITSFWSCRMQRTLVFVFDLDWC